MSAEAGQGPSAPATGDIEGPFTSTRRAPAGQGTTATPWSRRWLTPWAGVGYSISWILGLSIFSSSTDVGSSAAELQTAYAGHQGAATTQLILTEGLPAIALAVVVMSVARSVRARGLHRAALMTSFLGLGAALVSLVQSVLGLILVNRLIPDRQLDQALWTYHAFTRLDGLKMFLLAALVATSLVLVRRDRLSTPRWLVVIAGALTLTITVSGIGYLLLLVAPAAAALVALPLLLIWVSATSLTIDGPHRSPSRRTAMPAPFTRPGRLAGRLCLSLAAVVGLVGMFLALIVLTDGAGGGFVAWLTILVAGSVAVLWWARHRDRRTRLVRLLPVVAAAAVTASVCIPTVPMHTRSLSALPSVATQYWNLATGSRVAVYHYPPDPGSPRHLTPLLYLNGGPVRGISMLDHRFLQLLAGHGYDVYAYEQAGGGRSDLLPMEQYGIARSVRDLDAVIDHLGRGQVDVLGFSSGAVVLTQALAASDVATRVHRAIIAEPGPMDGPTAQITGQPGRPSARDLAPALTGPRSTQVPRYAVALGLMRVGLLSPDTSLIGQVEGDNAFTADDLGSDTASGYCAKDAHLIPAEDTPQNFSFSPAASLRVQQTIKDSPSLAPQLKLSHTVTMLMIAECSTQVRQWATTILADDPAIQRTQYLPGVGHHMWNGLRDNNERAATAISAFLEDESAPLPNYPALADVASFLRDQK